MCRGIFQRCREVRHGFDVHDRGPVDRLEDVDDVEAGCVNRVGAVFGRTSSPDEVKWESAREV